MKYRILLICLCAFINTKALQPSLNIISRNYLYGTIDNDSLKVNDYIFKDILGNDVKISDFKGKWILLDLWYSGCGACITCNEGLWSVHESMKNENIVFLSISIDRNKAMWLESITKNAKKSDLNPWAGKYYPPPGTITLYTGGTGYNNEFIKKYVSNNGYPKLLLINPNSILVSDELPRPDENPVVLTNYIYNVLSKVEK